MSGVFGLLTLGFFALCFVAGIVLLARGLHGKRINDRPICRRCGFDLDGAWTSRSDDAPPCSECGADLTLIGAVRRGEYRRRPLTIAAGALLLAMVASSIGFTWLGSSTSGLSLTPTWLLRMQLDDYRSHNAHRAARELMTRLARGDIRPSTQRDIADDVLEIQRAAMENEDGWQEALGDLFLAIRATGGVGDERFATFARQAIDFVAAIPAKIRPDWTLRPGVWARTHRGATSEFMWLAVDDAEERIVRMDGDTESPVASLGAEANRRIDAFAVAIGPESSRPLAGGMRVTALETGQHAYEVRANAAFFEREPTNNLDDRPIDTIEVALRQHFEVVGYDTEIVQWNRDPAESKAVRDAIRVTSVSASVDGDGVLVNIQVRVDDPPVGVGGCFNVGIEGATGPFGQRRWTPLMFHGRSSDSQRQSEHSSHPVRFPTHVAARRALGDQLTGPVTIRFEPSEFAYAHAWTWRRPRSPWGEAIEVVVERVEVGRRRSR
ncbi:MAG: hypothetical protein AAGK04_08195 [Planctomycetota bacterium]